MTEHDALLRTILQNPADDTARLVYADLLDESGKPWDAARAALIRMQIARVGAPPPEDWRSIREEEKLLKKWGAKWLPWTARFDTSALDWQVRGDYIQFPGMAFYTRYVFERGFLASVLVEAHDGRAFSPSRLGVFMRECLAHRPVEIFGIRLSGRVPSITVQIGPHLGDWLVSLWTDGDKIEEPTEAHPSQYICYARKALVAGLPKWIEEEMSRIEFETVTVTEYADDPEIPF